MSSTYLSQNYLHPQDFPISGGADYPPYQAHGQYFPQHEAAPPLVASHSSPSIPQAANQTNQAHTYASSGTPGTPALPNIQQLSLNSQAQPATPPKQRSQIRTRHDAFCDGCGVNPIRTEYRWHCSVCPDEDICNNCKEAGVSSGPEHLLKPVPAHTEIHAAYNCDGCNQMPIVGVRRRCLTHDNEDWCNGCFVNGRSCSGPFQEIKQSLVGIQIEQYGGVPMPEQWHQYLKNPISTTYRLSTQSHGDGWLCWQGNKWFYNRSFREMTKNDDATFELPVYGIDPEVEEHSMSDNKYKWTLVTSPAHDKKARKKLWDFALKMDEKLNVTKTELTNHKTDFKAFSSKNGTAFVHGPHHDSLPFSSPDGRHFRWQSNKPISTLHGERYDGQVYALFELANGSPQQIIADYSWWDGHADSPENAIRVRSVSQSLDHGLVIATLSALHAHQWLLMAIEAHAQPDAFEQAEQAARITYLGRQAYWKAGDDMSVIKDPAAAQAKGGGGTGPRRAAQIHEAVYKDGAMVAAASEAAAAAAGEGVSTAEVLETTSSALEVVNGVLELANTIAGNN